MPFFEMLPGGMPAGLQSDMDAVLNKKLGTSTSYPPENWPENVNLMGPLEEKTVSGSVVAFSDGADDVPLKSCEVALPASLDGYSSVDVVQTGKNLLNGEDAVKTANNIRFYYSSGKYYPAGTYTLSISESVSGLYVRNVSTNTNILVKYNSNFITFTLTEQTLIGFDLYKVGINQDNNVMLEVGSTASTFEPYSSAVYTASLGRTIYGGTADIVNGTGTDENGNDFTFTPVPINSLLGDNTLWSDGDLEVVYRSMGTETLIPPTLISKTITANGTYTASDEGADGYDEVTVNVPTGTTEPFKVLSINGTAGSETFTADHAGTYMFLVGTSAQGTASITSAVTPDLTFSKQSSDSRGLVGAIYTLGVGDTVTMTNSVVSWVYNTKVVVEMNISVSAVIDSAIVNDGTLPTFTPSVTGNALFISMAGGRSGDNSYDRTYTDVNAFEFFGKVETGLFLRIRYGSTVPSYQLYGFDGGCALAIVLQ